MERNNNPTMTDSVTIAKVKIKDIVEEDLELNEENWMNIPS